MRTWMTVGLLSLVLPTWSLTLRIGPTRSAEWIPRGRDHRDGHQRKHSNAGD